MSSNRGFTTIELITVIIIMAILAVNILPRFDGTASYEAHTHRAQLISALRLTQQRAMQQTSPDIASGNNYCHHIVFDATQARYGVPNRVDCDVIIFPSNWKPDATGHIVDDRYDMTFTIDSTSNKIISFDWLGRPNDCDNDGDLGCTILVESAVENGTDALKIEIEIEGYIHGIL